jgi:alpha-1,6-mannosyltransferase
MGKFADGAADAHGQSVKLTPSGRLYLLGACLFASLTACSRLWVDRGGPLFTTFLCAAGIAYLLAVRELLRTRRFAKPVVVVGIAIAGLSHLLFLWLPAGSDDDIRRYLWDGRVQRLGYNPYLIVADDPALQSWHTAETRGMNHPDLPTPYPAGAELFFRAITAMHESVFALKVAFFICDFAIAFLLLDVLRRDNQGSHLVLTYVWNPLLAVEVAGSGHIDIVGAFLLVLSFACLKRGRGAFAALAFALAVGVKFIPIVLLPLYWKRVRLRDGMLAIALFALLYVPFLRNGLVPIGSFGIYVLNWRFNAPVFSTLGQVIPPPVLSGVTALAGCVTAGWFRRKSPPWSADAFAWPIAALLLCAPVVYPWYLLWLLPFVTSVSTLPIIVWTVSIIPTYVVWHLRTLGRPWSVPGWITLLEYGSVAIAAAVFRSHLSKPPARAASSTAEGG